MGQKQTSSVDRYSLTLCGWICGYREID